AQSWNALKSTEDASKWLTVKRSSRPCTLDLTSDSGGESSCEEDEICKRTDSGKPISGGGDEDSEVLRKRCAIEGDDGINGHHGLCTGDEDSEVLRRHTDSGDETEEETSIRPSHTDGAHCEADPPTEEECELNATHKRNDDEGSGNETDVDGIIGTDNGSHGCEG
ncbi:hypothetical protein BGZ83_004620, partial [Gryganskiella cystojenkinii]